jgi:hypothetical protein
MSSLDGRNFLGVVLECGKTEGDADTIVFEDGRFRSIACDRYGYGDGPYTTIAAGDAVTFEAQTESPKYGKLLWHGVVRGRRLDGTLTMVRDGQRLGEKWVLAGEKE